MNKTWIAARNLLCAVALLAGLGLFLPGCPAYLPTLRVHYSDYYAGHSLGYWVRALDRNDAKVRVQAIVTLGAMGEDAAEAVPALARILTEDTNLDSRLQASLALKKIGAASAAAVPALAQALDQDVSPQVRMNAALALTQLGTRAWPAVPALMRALHRGANRTNLTTYSFTIQDAAALALGRATAGTSEGVNELMEALQKARTSNRRYLVAQALGDIGTPARPAVPLLVPLLADEFPEVQESAKVSLRKIRGE